MHKYKNKRRPKKTKITGSCEKNKSREKKTATEAAENLRRRHPVFLFLFIFAALMGVFYVFAFFSPFYDRHFPNYLGLNAKLSGYILGFLGQDITVQDALISSPAFSIVIRQGCDAIEPTVLFICAVLAFPAPFASKIPGIITGAVFLAILNLVRIVTLFLAGVYLPNAFQFIHIEAWQGLFIFFAILLWVFWLLWTGKRQVSG